MKRKVSYPERALQRRMGRLNGAHPGDRDLLEGIRAGYRQGQAGDA